MEEITHKTKVDVANIHPIYEPNLYLLKENLKASFSSVALERSLSLLQQSYPTEDKKNSGIMHYFLYLNRSNTIIGITSINDKNEKLNIRKAITYNACSIIILTINYNPICTGLISSQNQLLSFSKHIKPQLNLFDISLLDHIYTNKEGNQYTSLADEGAL